MHECEETIRRQRKNPMKKLKGTVSEAHRGMRFHSITRFHQPDWKSLFYNGEKWQSIETDQKMKQMIESVDKDTIKQFENCIPHFKKKELLFWEREKKSAHTLFPCISRGKIIFKQTPCSAVAQHRAQSHGPWNHYMSQNQELVAQCNEPHRLPPLYSTF